MSFAQNIKKIRNKLELTQEQAGKLLAVKKHNVSSWEEGRAVPSLSVIQNIIRVYQVPQEKTYKFLFGEI